MNGIPSERDSASFHNARKELLLHLRMTEKRLTSYVRSLAIWLAVRYISDRMNVHLSRVNHTT